MIGIIGALADEVKKLAARLEDAKTVTVGGMEFTVGRIANHEAVLCICGMGKVFASMYAEAMIREFSPELIINVGAAGTLTDELHITDIAVGTKVVQHDMDNSPLGYRKGEIAELSTVYFPCDEKVSELLLDCARELSLKALPCPVATGDVFVCSEEMRKSIRERFGAYCAEMEGGAVAQVCAFHKTPFGLLRAISDEAGGDAPEDFPAFLEKVTDDATALLCRFFERYGA